MKNKYAAVVLLFALLASALPALETPALSGRVNDLAGVFSSSEIRGLEEKLASLEASGAAQMAVLTVKSLEGDSLEEFSIRTADKWKLGDEGKDNGVLLILALEERKVRLEIGYGLEGELTDAKSGYIIREIIIPWFSKGDYASGMAAGIEAVASVAGGETNLVPAAAPVRQSSSRRSVPVNFLVILFIIFFNSFGRMGRRRRGGLFGFLMLNSLLGGSRHRGGFGGGGFGSGGGGFGGGGFGGGGGGFGGGGGGFGGGGASGGW